MTWFRTVIVLVAALLLLSPLGGAGLPDQAHRDRRPLHPRRGDGPDCPPPRRLPGEEVGAGDPRREQDRWRRDHRGPGGAQGLAPRRLHGPHRHPHDLVDAHRRVEDPAAHPGRPEIRGPDRAGPDGLRRQGGRAVEELRGALDWVKAHPDQLIWSSVGPPARPATPPSTGSPRSAWTPARPRWSSPRARQTR